MEASILDLRYKMKDVLSALAKNEKITVLYRGKVKGFIIPKSNDKVGKVKDHPLFGLHSDKKKTVRTEMKELRKSRYHAI